MIPISKNIDFGDPAILSMVRIAYVASNVAIVAIYLYIQSVVNKRKGAFPVVFWVWFLSWLGG